MSKTKTTNCKSDRMTTGHLEGFALRKAIGDILGVRDDGTWTYLDRGGVREKGLYIVHYTDEGAKKSGDLRGVIVDVDHQCVICSSFGATPSATVTSIPPEGALTFTDDDGQEHTIVIEDTVFKAGFEGFLIRVVKHDGIVYFTTHRNMRPTSARWGDFSMPTFMEMYESLGGPKGDDLFPADVQFSPYVYIFLVVHPKLLVGTRQDVGPGYIVHLETRKMWETSPFGVKEDVGQPKEFVSTGSQSATITAPFLYVPPEMTPEEANDFLEEGYYDSVYDNVWLRTGEFVVAHFEGKIFRLQSPSYSWRTSLRNNNPIIRHQFISSLVDDTRTRNLLIKYLPIDLSCAERINEMIPALTLPLAPTSYTTEADRLKLIWLNFLLSLPLQRQHEATTLLTDFLQDRDKMIAWLCSIKDNRELIANHPNKRIEYLIREARKTGPDRFQQTLTSLVVREERGASLYRLIKAAADSVKKQK